MEGIYFSGVGQVSSVGREELEDRTHCVKNPGGRPNRLRKEELEQILDIYYTKPYSLRKIARIMDVSVMTVWRAIRQYENEVLNG